MTSVRTIPKVVSVSSSIASALEGAKNAAQPQPESYFVSEVKSSAPHPEQRYVPGSKTWSYSPEKGASVPFSRRTWNCSGVSSARHSASVFWTFVITLPRLLPPYSLARRRSITRVRDTGPGRSGRSGDLRGGAEMKEAVILMRFLRHDPVGQRFGVAVLVFAWLAVAWTSITFAAAVPLLLAVAEVMRRRREEEAYPVDDLEDLY